MGRRGALVALAVAVVALGSATAAAWDRGEGPARSSPPALGPAQDGAALFAAKGCAVCHLGPGATDGGGIGPDLRAVAGASPSYLRESILRPGASVAIGPFPMPRLPVSPAEADLIVAFLRGVDTGTPSRTAAPAGR